MPPPSQYAARATVTPGYAPTVLYLGLSRLNTYNIPLVFIHKARDPSKTGSHFALASYNSGTLANSVL